MQLVQSSPQAVDIVRVGFSLLARLALPLIVAIAWGAQFLVAKGALATVNPSYLTTIRYIIASLLLLATFALSAKPVSPGRPRRATQQRRAAPETERWTRARA